MKKTFILLWTILLLVYTQALIGCDQQKVGTKKTKDKQTKSKKAENEIETKEVRVGDINMAYRITGKGYPFILIMGFNGTMDFWDESVLNKLSSKYKIIIFDNRGMGETTAPPGDFTIRQFADDTAGLMDALNIDRAHVLGWSMGTNIAQELALNYPQKVNKLVLYAADCGGTQAVQPSREFIKDLADISISEKEREKRLYEALFPKNWLDQHPDFYEKFPHPKKSIKLENVLRQFKAMEQFSSFDRLPQITQPTLLITGTEDNLTPPENSLIMANRIPNAWLIQFQGGGHEAMYQEPSRFSQIIIDFLD